MTTATQHLAIAQLRVNGKDDLGYDLTDEKKGQQEAALRVQLASAVEQQITNTHLASIADSLARIATAMAQPPHRQPIPDGTLIAYPNQSGALVTVTQTGPVGATTYPWNCTACTAGAHVGFTTLGYSQTAAEKHAAQCNALYIPTAA